MYVCMYACMHACMHEWHVFACMKTYMFTYTYMHLPTQTDTDRHTRTEIKEMSHGGAAVRAVPWLGHRAHVIHDSSHHCPVQAEFIDV